MQNLLWRARNNKIVCGNITYELMAAWQMGAGFATLPYFISKYEA